jgi:CRISPR system Cascade subunit CasE
MHLSVLLVNLGENPDRPRPGRLWLRNRYRVHQRLCMAFPSVDRKSADPLFLHPYDPADFVEDRQLAEMVDAGAGAAETRHVHSPRSEASGFLFRIDPVRGGTAAIVVLSAIPPQWDYAFRNARHLLRCSPQVRPYDPPVALGGRYRFRLEANAVVRLRDASKFRDGTPVRAGWAGKRVGVRGDADSLESWLKRRAVGSGFRLEHLTLAQAGYAFVQRPAGPAGGVRLRTARYEGVLSVVDPAGFRCALISGIGPAKAFGFGLLTIAPMRDGLEKAP